MKTKIVLTRACITIAIMLTAFYTWAQQTQIVNPVNTTGQAAGIDAATHYTYKIFQAPNKMYGYDISLNGKIIFHQGASPLQPNRFVAALAKKEHADKAALLAIEKIKNNKPATLTQQEIKKITDQ